MHCGHVPTITVPPLRIAPIPPALSTETDRWHLTPTEAAVVLTLSEGASNREIADRLFMSARTVEVHLTRAFRKAGVRGRTQLVARLFLR